MVHLFTLSSFDFLAATLLCAWILVTEVQAEPVDPLFIFRLKTHDGRYLSAFQYGPKQVLTNLVPSVSGMQSEDFIYDPCLFQLRSFQEQHPVNFYSRERQLGDQVMTEVDCTESKLCTIWAHFKPSNQKGGKASKYLVTYNSDSLHYSLVQEGSTRECDDYEFQLEIVTNGVKSDRTRNIYLKKYPTNRLCVFSDPSEPYNVWKNYFNLRDTSTAIPQLCFWNPLTWPLLKHNMLKNGMSDDIRLYVIPTSDTTKSFLAELELQMLKLQSKNKDDALGQTNFDKILIISMLAKHTIIEIASSKHTALQAFFAKKAFPGGYEVIRNSKLLNPSISFNLTTGHFLTYKEFNRKVTNKGSVHDPRDIIAHKHKRLVLNRGKSLTDPLNHPGRSSAAPLSSANGVDVYVVGDGLYSKFRLLRDLENANVAPGFTMTNTDPGVPIPPSKTFLGHNSNSYLGTFAAAEIHRLAPTGVRLFPVRILSELFDVSDVFKIIESISLYAKQTQRASVVRLDLPLYQSNSANDQAYVAFLKVLNKVLQSYPSLAFVLSMRPEHVASFGHLVGSVAMLVSVDDGSSRLDHSLLQKLPYHLYTPPTLMNNAFLKDEPLGPDFLDVTEYFHPSMASAIVTGVVASNWGIFHAFNATSKATDVFDFTMRTASKLKDGKFIPHRLSDICPITKGNFNFQWDERLRVYLCLSADKRRSPDSIDLPDAVDTTMEEERGGVKVQLENDEVSEADTTTPPLPFKERYRNFKDIEAL